MSNFGVTFNGKHSYQELGLTIVSKSIGNPSKKKTLVSIPFSNTDYDMSLLYGEQIYDNRKITYDFNVYDRRSHSKEAMVILKIAALNHFMTVNQKSPLVDDTIIGYHFLAEVVEEPSFSEKNGKGLLQVSFDCYCFKVANDEEGTDVWDSFNFVLDIAQETHFKVKNRLSVSLFNIGATSIVPTIQSDTEIIIRLAGRDVIIGKGITHELDFRLKVGENKLTLYGNGNLSFHWHKEVI